MNKEIYALPGDTQTVEVEAGAGGAVAGEHFPVELVGSTNRNPTVRACTTRGAAIGVLDDTPEDYDSTASYNQGDNLGKSTLILTKPVVVLGSTATYTPSIGDWVINGSAGGYEKWAGPQASSVSGVTNALGVDNNGNLEADGYSGEVQLPDVIPAGQVFHDEIPEFDSHTAVPPGGSATDLMAVALIR